MIRGYSPVVQALLGTLFTWGLTAVGSALVFVFNSQQRKVLDASLGFAAGVMIAASFWSLLAPAIEIAEKSGSYGSYAFLPVAVGFFFGALFVHATDVLIPSLEFPSPHLKTEPNDIETTDSYVIGQGEEGIGNVRWRGPRSGNSHDVKEDSDQNRCWRRIFLLVLAITMHNIPEGLAVGVAFAAVDQAQTSTFESARNLAVGIGIQNFPEGLAVSMPLRGAGVSPWKSFWYGQLSGIVEPVAGLLGALTLTIARPLLPYALAFAAGAMIYVAIDDIIPEAQTSGNGRLASWSAVTGFLVMLILDVGLS